MGRAEKMMKNMLRTLGLLALTLTLLGGVSATASARTKVKTVKNPKADTAYGSILNGIKLIQKGSFDAWIDGFCHEKELCYNDAATSALKKYNLPALHRLAEHCLKDKGTTLHVTKDEDKAGGGKKIFIKCHDKGMPRPFHLKKEGKKWLWTNV